MKMPSTRLKQICAAAALATMASAAPAATQVLNLTLDITQPGISGNPQFDGWQGAPAFAPGSYLVPLAVSDELNLTIDFMGSQSLTLTDATVLWALSFSTTGDGVEGQGHLELLDANGVAFLTSATKNSTEGSVHFGQNFFDADFVGGLAGPLTFYGVRYVGTVLNYPDGDTTRDYNQPGFIYSARDASVDPGQLPEPGSLALAALALLGLGARRVVKRA